MGSAINGGSSSSSSSSAPMTASGKNVPRRRWSSFVPIFVALVVVAEIGFLGRLDMSKNAAVVHSWTSSFYFPSLSSSVQLSSPLEPQGGNEFAQGEKECIDWLEQHDAIPHSRDFTKDPILVAGSDEDWSSCSVGCKFGHVSGKQPDAAFGLPHQTGTASVLRSMESSHYYAENNVAQARGRGYKVVMTTSLSSDVPVGYFSWAEYDIMAPVPPKTEEALAAAFISNCGARNFRLQALEKLEDLKITIDSYGSCHRNHDGRVDKVETLKRYKFSLAFENSNEEDYVTEKFFQSLVAGAVPIVVGAPNIQDFAPCPGSVLHIKELDDVSSVAKAMRHLSANPDAYNQSLRWKYEGPSDSFKALVDMAAVHSSCRLCIHLATKIYENDENSPKIQNRPCECTSKEGTLIYHLFVRERGRFKFESIFLRSFNLTISALENAVMKQYKSLGHVPVWKQDRPASIRGGSELKIYRVYPFSLTQREALYSFRFHSDDDFRQHIKDHPCAKFEVIFV